MVATLRPIGGIQIVRKDAWIPAKLKAQMREWDPKTRLGQIIKDCFGYLPEEMAAELFNRVMSCGVFFDSSLELVIFRHPDSIYRHGGPLVNPLGIVSRKKVTTQGVTALCVAWGNAAFDMKYMGLGTASGAEANTDTTASFVEITATHYTGSTRVTCTHAESTNTVPIVGTHTQATAGDTIEEHGIFDSATQEAGNLWDRSLTGTQTLGVGDGLQGTLTLTASAEA